jgi:signal transduction histidine kinase
VRITASLTDAGVEVIDDGEGNDGNGSRGHGIDGLAERARLVDGTLSAGVLAGGGYRLAVTVPVPRA